MNPLARAFVEAMGQRRMRFWDKYDPAIYPHPTREWYTVVVGDGEPFTGHTFTEAYDKCMTWYEAVRG